MTPAVLRRLVAAARLLNSDKEGEQLAALNAIGRLLPAGQTLGDVVERALAERPQADWSPRWQAPRVPAWQMKARTILLRMERLTAKDLAFVTNMAGARFQPTEAQSQWLDDLAERVAA